MNPKTWLQYNEISLQASSIFQERNAIYSDAFRETGLYGAVVEIIGQTARLRTAARDQMALSRPVDKAKVRDILIDQINFCIIGVMMLEDENWMGTDPEEEAS